MSWLADMITTAKPVQAGDIDADEAKRAALAVGDALGRGVLTRADALTVLQALGLADPEIWAESAADGHTNHTHGITPPRPRDPVTGTFRAQEA